eukprot:TRINITY_DN226_c0_g1::TRINITY_DN226_c0_g1_i1::g.1669::m.1669 TRINITY_DN226_c0_g1::TRINITY_DN226_c0_g1_i1::g.1669  ORF type:complete len:188 (+),score=40.72,sp/Q7XUP7/MSR21_ORYSJ/61.35/3e-71,PMSR/PF01625.16/4.1e-64 TRINITY_DN226_c0_g1_i1:70-564(+)
MVESAVFAAGCFWSVELRFQRVPGVLSTAVGYTGGHHLNPTYKEVCSGTTGHAEAVKLTFDPKEVSYQELLNIFFEKHNPTQLNRQGNDVGTQYRSAIYYFNDAQKTAAIEAKAAAQQKYTTPVVTEIVPAVQFYPAEDYHQRYLEKGGQCSSKGCADAIRCYG